MFNINEACVQDYPEIERLYIEAFPKEERQPFKLIRKATLKGKGVILVAKEDNEFIGFVSLIIYENLVYFFYLAIEDKYRGNGYGSKIIAEVNKRYSGSKIFLARETLDEKADNYNQRIRRHEFYLKNGLVDLPYHIREGKVVYDIMGNGKIVTAKEYAALMENWCGRLLTKLVPLKILED